MTPLSLTDIERTYKAVKMTTDTFLTIGDAMTRFGLMDDATSKALGAHMKSAIFLLMGYSHDGATIGPPQARPGLWTVQRRTKHLGLIISKYELAKKLAKIDDAVTSAYRTRYGRLPGHVSEGSNAYTEEECLALVDTVIRGFM